MRDDDIRHPNCVRAVILRNITHLQDCHLKLPFARKLCTRDFLLAPCALSSAEAPYGKFRFCFSLSSASEPSLHSLWTSAEERGAMRQKLSIGRQANDAYCY